LSDSSRDSKAVYTVYLILGSNIDPLENTRRALALLSEQVQVQAVSGCWETPPYGTDGPHFINTAVCIRTGFEAETLKLEVLRPIEQKLGRVREADKFAPRPIDLDIIIFDRRVIDQDLWTLAHVALPFAELLPDMLHTESGKRLSEIASALNQNGAARRLGEISGGKF